MIIFYSFSLKIAIENRGFTITISTGIQTNNFDIFLDISIRNDELINEEGN